MTQSDPNNSRYSAAKELVKRMDYDNQVAVVTFNHEAAVVLPLTPISEPQNREKVLTAIDNLETTEGGTNISGAISEALQVIDADSK